MTLNRRTLLQLSAAALVQKQNAAERSRPNFVFILSDDHHYQCVGAAGNPNVQTPNLDRLARRGVQFANGQISTAQCAPSRGILLSGLETYQNGLKSNGATSFRSDLGPTVIEQLRRNGYDTGLVGKWHIHNKPAECGFARAPLWLAEGGSKYVDPVLIRGTGGTPKQESGHITELFTDAASEFIRSAKQPFFLWLAYNAPHSPLFAPQKYMQLYEGKPDLAPPAHPRNAKPFNWVPYYAVITHLDEAVGRLVSQLERSGLWENTVVVFLGDNGFLCGTKGLNGKVHPWEESVRVPLIAAGGPVRGGIRIEDPAASIDLPATWLEFAGVRPASPVSGRSLKTVLTTGQGGPSDAFSVWDDPRPEALVVKTAVEPYRLIRTRTHKLIVWESRRQAVYNHVADPAEERNLVDTADQAKIVKDLRERLAARMRATKDHAIAWLG